VRVLQEKRADRENHEKPRKPWDYPQEASKPTAGWLPRTRLVVRNSGRHVLLVGCVCMCHMSTSVVENIPHSRGKGMIPQLHQKVKSSKIHILMRFSAIFCRHIMRIIPFKFLGGAAAKINRLADEVQPCR